MEASRASRLVKISNDRYRVDVQTSRGWVSAGEVFKTFGTWGGRTPTRLPVGPYSTRRRVVAAMVDSFVAPIPSITMHGPGGIHNPVTHMWGRLGGMN